MSKLKRPIPSEYPDHTAAHANLPAPTVLVIDNDSAFVSQCGSILRDLGYDHCCSMTVQDALQRIESNANIQIVIVDLQNMQVDGSNFIHRIRRLEVNRSAIAIIIATNDLKPDLSILAIYSQAVDILHKPLELSSCSGALLRALSYLDARKPAIVAASISILSDRLAQVVAALEERFQKPAPDEVPNEEKLGATLQWLLRSRNQRNRFFPMTHFADPAWDILLDLTRAELEGQQVSVSSVCIAASVPLSTALRWVRQMTEANLLHRWTDPMDRRRDLIALTPQTSERMREYLASVYKDHQIILQ